MAFPFKSPKHTKNRAIDSHGSSCSCGSCDSGAAALANNRKIGDSLQPRGFQDSLKAEVERSTLLGEDKFLSNVDAIAFSVRKTPSVVFDTYILAGVIAKMEANTEFFDKNSDKVVAGNCGKRVMPDNLRRKILGDSAASSFVFSDDKIEKYKAPPESVKIIGYKDSISFEGVMCCHNVWGCPICARKLSERRKQGLQKLLTAHFDKFGVDTVTASLFTIPHSKYDDLADISKRLLKCYSDMTRSRGYKQLMKTLNGCGSSRALEVTWSLVNAFHPHVHVLNFFEQNLLLDHQFISDTLFNLWADALKKNCFDPPSRQAFGCNLIPSTKHGIEAVAEYFSKSESDVNDADIMGYLKKHKGVVRSVTTVEGREVMGWQTEHEMTKWHLKQARSDGENFRYSMFDFVRGYSIADDNGDEDSKKQFRTLWLNYRKAFKGKRQLWTRHKHFKISELEMTDSELGEQELDEPEKKTIAVIDFRQWLVVVFMNARATLLEKARKKGSEGVSECLDFVTDAYVSFFPDDPCGYLFYLKNKN